MQAGPEANGLDCAVTRRAGRHTIHVVQRKNPVWGSEFIVSARRIHRVNDKQQLYIVLQSHASRMRNCSISHHINPMRPGAQSYSEHQAKTGSIDVVKDCQS